MPRGASVFAVRHTEAQRALCSCVSFFHRVGRRSLATHSILHRHPAAFARQLRAVSVRVHARQQRRAERPGDLERVPRHGAAELLPAAVERQHADDAQQACGHRGADVAPAGAVNITLLRAGVGDSLSPVGLEICALRFSLLRVVSPRRVAGKAATRSDGEAKSKLAHA